MDIAVRLWPKAVSPIASPSGPVVRTAVTVMALPETSAYLTLTVRPTALAAPGSGSRTSTAPPQALTM